MATEGGFGWGRGFTSTVHQLNLKACSLINMFTYSFFIFFSISQFMYLYCVSGLIGLDFVFGCSDPSFFY